MKNLLNEFFEKNNIKPVAIFNNLGDINVQRDIRNYTRELSGIYLIFNNITGDYYIGSGSTGRMYSRFYRHLLNFTGSKIVKNAVRKYKINNFTYLILEIFPKVVNKENNKDLMDLEDLYLKSLLPNYNILTEAGSSFGYKHTEVTRLKMKNNYSLLRKNFIGNLNRGKSLSDVTKKKLSDKAKDRKLVYSKQGYDNLKKASKPVILYNLDKTVFGKYYSITDAAYNINCSVKTISRALRTEKKIVKRRFIVCLDS